MAIRFDRAGIVGARADLRKDRRRQSEPSIVAAIVAGLRRAPATHRRAIAAAAGGAGRLAPATRGGNKLVAL
jgi:hypothetical protein